MTLPNFGSYIFDINGLSKGIFEEKRVYQWIARSFVDNTDLYAIQEKTVDIENLFVTFSMQYEWEIEINYVSLSQIFSNLGGFYIVIIPIIFFITVSLVRPNKKDTTLIMRDILENEYNLYLTDATTEHKLPPTLRNKR